jgi:hypothetical protein
MGEGSVREAQYIISRAAWRLLGSVAVPHLQNLLVYTVLKMSSNTDIHVGFWTNYSKGAVVGSTLTLPSRNGAILVAALAIFIHVSIASSTFP